jgi:hypothetical protein
MCEYIKDYFLDKEILCYIDKNKKDKYLNTKLIKQKGLLVNGKKEGK